MKYTHVHGDLTGTEGALSTCASSFPAFAAAFLHPSNIRASRFSLAIWTRTGSGIFFTVQPQRTGFGPPSSTHPTMPVP